MEGEERNTHPPEAPVMSASRPASSLSTDIEGGIPNQPNDPDRIPEEAMLSRARFAIANNEFRMVELGNDCSNHLKLMISQWGELSPPALESSSLRPSANASQRPTHEADQLFQG